jgi:uncharacterized protein (DUF1697 family)
MPCQIVLLRGINVGAANRIPMPELRTALTAAGHRDVRTYVQSGNVVVHTDADGPALGRLVHDLIFDRFALDIPVVTRTAGELAAIVAGNPFPEAAATDPKRLQVTFLSEPVADDVAERVRGASSGMFSTDIDAISLSISHREVYGWHPAGIHASTLARELSDRRLRVTATARNWTTVTTLLEMASDHAG